MRRLELDDLYRIPQISDPRISPDASRVAFVVMTTDREKDTNKSAIWIVSTNGDDGARPLTTGDNDSSPRWSPDGRWLAFVAGCDGTPTVFKVASSAPFGTPVPLLPGAPSCTPGTTSYPRQPATLAGRLRFDDSVAWSPDGRHIAFRGGQCQGVFDDCLTVADIAGGGDVTVDAYGGGGEVYSGFAVVPAWRPDGARLAWTAWRDGDEHGAAQDAVQPVHVLESDPTGAGRHTVGTAQDRELAYYDTTRALVTATRDGGSWLVLLNLATGTRTYLRPGSQPSPRPGSMP